MTKNNVHGLSRRRFVAGAAAGVGLAGFSRPVRAQAAPRVVVIGGGFGGATAAKYVRMFDPAIQVTLIDPARSHITCPFSNYVLAGFRTMDSITHSFINLRANGVTQVLGTATAIDPVAKTVRLAAGDPVPYDRLIVSPGIDVRFDAVPGYDEAASEKLPHAWKAGSQTLLLRQQLESMRDGGVVLMSVPGNPYRCPPGPYERAAMIAHYLKTAKPRSKILILDSKEMFSKQPLFQDGWKALYGDMIEWVPASKDGIVKRVDAGAMTLHTDFAQHKGDVINFIAPQWAGAIARSAGLTNQTGFCPVDPVTFESTVHRGIHVIGDSSIAGALPKSGFAANSEGKVCAMAVVNLLKGRPPEAPTYVNTCYSLVGPDYGISVAGIYKPGPQGIVEVPNSGGTSPREAPLDARKAEAVFAEGWYRSITADIYG